MEVGEVGSLVWVKRKNGKWWPGKVVSLNQISASDHLSFASTSRTPIKLLGRKDGSVEWHKLEDSRRVKSFRCGDFDDSIRRAESSQLSPCIKRVKYAHQEDAILHALQLEKQEQETKLKRPGKVQREAISQGKRSRCVHLPVESFHHVQHSVLHSQSVKISPSTSVIDDYYLKSIVAENTSSEATISDLSGRDIQDSEGIIQPTGSSGSCRRQTKSMIVRKKKPISNSSDSFLENLTASSAGVKKQKPGEILIAQNGRGTPSVVTNVKNSVKSRNRRHSMRELLMVNAACQEKSRCWYEAKSGDHLALEVNKLSHSSCECNHSEDSDSLSFGLLCTEHLNWIETMLIDVEVTVLANHRREDVPLVSLMSRLNRKAIIGHPIQTEALDETSEVFLVRKGKFHHRLENDENRMKQLVWRTSKRTPICYISNVHSSPSKGEETEASKISDGCSLRARKGSPPTEKALWKPQTEAGFSKNEARKIINSKGQKDGLEGQKGCVKQGVTCVPVNFVLTNLLLAVGRE